MPSIPLKKIILLFFMSLFFSSSSFAGIENWADTSVCLWLKSSGGGNPVPLAEAKKRGISCKDGKVIKSQQKSSKIQIELAASVYAKTSNQLLCNWVKTYPNNQEILKEYRKRVANQNNPCQEALKEKAKLDSEALMKEIIEDAKVSKYAKTSNQLLCNWVKTYPNNQEILKEYRKRVAN
jgi:TRAP-type mannitol/chloroaromatic compound transport system substrate-binding protein